MERYSAGVANSRDEGSISELYLLEVMISSSNLSEDPASATWPESRFHHGPISLERIKVVGKVWLKSVGPQHTIVDKQTFEGISLEEFIL